VAEGKIKTWISDRGFGFIQPDDGSHDVFSHIREFEKAGMAEPEVGECVAYEVDMDKSRRPAAVKLKALP
jgi:CspA family cold shock protein